MTDKIRQARVKGLLRVRLMREPIEPLKPVGLTVQCGGESELVRSLRESVEIPGWKIESKAMSLSKVNSIIDVAVSR